MKEKVLNALVDLLKVKSIITIMMVTTACALCAQDRMDTAVFVGLVSSIITYYFTRKDTQNEVK